MSITDELLGVQPEPQDEPVISVGGSITDSLLSTTTQQIEQPPFPGLDKPMPIPGVEERAEPTLRSEFQEFHKMNNEFLMEQASKYLSFGIDLISPEKSYPRVKKLAQGAIKTGQGFGQFMSTGLEMMGVLDEGTTAKFTQLSIEQRRKFEEEFIKEFGESATFELAEAVGQFLPLIAVPGGGGIVAAPAVGAVVGASEFHEETDPKELLRLQMKGAKEGALWGVAASTINLFPKMKNWWKEKLLGAEFKAKKVVEPVGIKGKDKWKFGSKVLSKEQKLTAQRTKFTEEGVLLSERTGVPFKLSQLTGDDAAEAMENLSRLTLHGERLARDIETKQVVKSYQLWKKIEAKLFQKAKIAERAANPNIARFSPRASDAFEKVMGDSYKKTGLLGARAENARKNFAFLDDVTGKQPVIPINNFRNELRKQARVGSMRGASSQQKALKKNAEELLEQFPDGSMATGEELQNLLTQYSRASKGKVGVIKDLDVRDQLRPTRDIFGALSKDLDEASLLGDAGEALKKAREQYIVDSAPINAIQDSIVGKLFGSGKRPTDIQIAATFHRMDPTELKTTMNVLSKADPELHKMLQRFWVERWILKSSRSAAKDAFPFIAGKMAGIADEPAFKAVFNTAESRKTVMDGVAVARRIMMFNRTTGGVSSAKTKELARIMASRDTTFMSGFAAEVFTPRLISKAVLDKDGIKALETLSKPFDTKRFAAALATLNEIDKEQE